MKNEMKRPTAYSALTEEEKAQTRGGATDPYFREPETTLLGSVTAVLFGLSLIGGGIYSIKEWSDVTAWAIPGGLSAVVAGTSCMARGIFQIVEGKE